MAKKDLTKAIAKGADVFFSTRDAQQEHEVAEPQGAQREPNEQEVHEAAEAQHTQGRKGFKMPKMNTSYTPSNMDYLKTMAAINGVSVTRYVNTIIDQHRAANAERYEKAKEVVRDE